MWIEKQKNGKYKFSERYVNPLTGKNAKVSITLEGNRPKDKKLAREMLNKKIADKGMTQFDSITFEELSLKWHAVHKLTIKQSTAANVSDRMKVINKSIGYISSQLISPQIVNSFLLKELTENELKYRTVSYDKSIILRILKFGVLYGYCEDKNYDGLVMIPEINMSKKNDLKYLEPEEIEQLIKELKEKGKDEVARLCQIQISLGLRYNELVAINYNTDIDFENKVLHITKNYDPRNNIFTTPKTGESRSLYFNDQVENWLREQIEYDKKKMLSRNLDRDNTLLFRQRNERPIHIRTVNRTLKEFNINGKSISTHYFRHTFATLMAQNGADPHLVAKHMGHSSTKMVDKVYRHFTNKMDENLKTLIAETKII